MIAKLVMVASCHRVSAKVHNLGQAPTIREYAAREKAPHRIGGF
jgi:hypothetical protein